MNPTRKDEVRRLWCQCFDDGPEFTDLYFALRYREDNTLTCERQGRVVSALQILPYLMTFGAPMAGHDQPEPDACGADSAATMSMGYVSGACTHPDWRGQGLMRRLLHSAFDVMRGQGMVVSVLILAESWLHDYYARSGYADVFQRRTVVCRSRPDGMNSNVLSGAPSDFGAMNLCVDQGDGNEAMSVSVLECLDRFSDEATDYLDRHLRRHPCCVLHPRDDLRVVEADLRLCQGQVCLLRHRGSVVAMAVAWPVQREGKRTLAVEELLADSPECGRQLLRQMGRKLGTDTFYVATTSRINHPCLGQQASQEAAIRPNEAASDTEARPWGMVRVLDAKALLTLYASLHPSLRWTFALLDTQIADNSGLYRLGGGTCQMTALPPDAVCFGEATGPIEQIDVAQLAHRLFGPLQPHMSLMLD